VDILILGGTHEAHVLADRLVERRHRVTTAMAGRTSRPNRPRGRLLTGGFGGAEGLAGWLTDNRADFLIDATHPFAAEISANAVAASEAARVPMVRLERPGFVEPPQARWWRAASLEDALERLPQGAATLLTVGRQHLDALNERPDVHFIVRVIDTPDIALPANVTLIRSRPPFLRQDELALMKREGITHLVSKDAGGQMTSAKLEAAFMLKVQVVMIDRPELPPAETATSIDEVLKRIDQLPAPARSFFFPWLRNIWAKPAS